MSAVALNNAAVPMSGFKVRHHVYTESYDKLKDHRSYAVTRHGRDETRRAPTFTNVRQMPGFCNTITLAGANPAAFNNVPEEAARNMPGKIRLLIGQLPYTIQRHELLYVLQILSGRQIYGLRPQYRKNTGKRQVTGVWFVDVHVNDVQCFTDIHRVVLMHESFATVFNKGCQKELYAWCQARDAAHVRATAAADQHQQKKVPRPLQPMTVEVQSEDRMKVIQFVEEIRVQEHFRAHPQVAQSYMRVACSMANYKFQPQYCSVVA